MLTQRILLTGLLVLALLAPGASQSLAQPVASPAAPAYPAAPGSVLIVENAGQWPESARFQVWNSPLGPGTTWLAEDAIWLVVSKQVDKEEVDKDGRSDCDDSLVSLPTCPPDYSSHALKLTFPGSNPDVRMEPFGAVDTTVSYFLGNDPEQWRPDVPVWGGLRYVDLYPDVDLVLDGQDAAWRLEAANDAAVEQVRVQIEGAEIAALDGAALRLDAAGGPISLDLPGAPFSYRVMGVASSGSAVTLVLSEPRPNQTHQPADKPGALLYSTFLGGSGLSDSAAGIDVDGSGSAYVAGSTGSTDFPTTPGAFDPSFNAGFYDAFVAKFNRTGNALVYATFLGGSGFYEGASDVTVDAMGNAYVIGTTDSTDFPTTPGAYDATFNGEGDAFVAKLNPTGSALVYASYLGGNGSDYGTAIDMDGLGTAYVLGHTFSNGFPTTPGAFDTSHNGSTDVFITKVNPAGSALVYSTFLGGGRGDEGRGLAVDAAGNAFLAGYTGSGNFPVTPGAYDPTFNGGPYGSGDAFVAKLNPAGSALVYATFLGGSEGNDDGSGIAVEATGSACVSGSTSSSDFATTPGAFDPTYNGALDGFLVKLNPAGSALIYATFLGTSGLDGAYGVAVDGAGNAFAAGITNSADFPTTPDAFDTSFNGGSDAVLVKFNPSGGMLYGTFFGGSGSEGAALAIDASGIAYLAGGTSSADLPTTPGAFDASYNGGDGDAYVAQLNLAPYTPNVLAPIEQPPAGAFVSGAVTLRGYAIDLGSSAGTGIDMVHIYLDGPYGTGTIIGAATYGLDRPDLAVQYGARFGPSGWELVWDTAGLAPGAHRLYLYAHRTTDSAWSVMEPHLVVAPGGPARWLPIVLRQR